METLLLLRDNDGNESTMMPALEFALGIIVVVFRQDFGTGVGNGAMTGPIMSPAVKQTSNILFIFLNIIKLLHFVFYCSEIIRVCV